MQHVDKNSVKHFGVNFLLALLLGAFGVTMGIGASLTKEYCDVKSYGHWCWVDLMFDAAGQLMGFGLHVLLMWLCGIRLQ